MTTRHLSTILHLKNDNSTRVLLATVTKTFSTFKLPIHHNFISFVLLTLNIIIGLAEAKPRPGGEAASGFSWIRTGILSSVTTFSPSCLVGDCETEFG